MLEGVIVAERIAGVKLKIRLLKVRPYYLHHPDLAPGTSHFRVPMEVGQELMRVL
jgi:lysine 2,3-aminomutase